MCSLAVCSEEVCFNVKGQKNTSDFAVYIAGHVTSRIEPEIESHRCAAVRVCIVMTDLPTSMLKVGKWNFLTFYIH